MSEPESGKRSEAALVKARLSDEKVKALVIITGVLQPFNSNERLESPRFLALPRSPGPLR